MSHLLYVIDIHGLTSILRCGPVANSLRGEVAPDHAPNPSTRPLKLVPDRALVVGLPVKGQSREVANISSSP
jgi:hypothetical protein